MKPKSIRYSQWQVEQTEVFSATRDQWRRLIAAQIEKKPEIGKTKTTSDTKSEHPLVFFNKTENQMLKNGKSTNYNENRNRKNRRFLAKKKKRKTDLINGQNRKIENPNTLLLWFCFYESQSTSPLM